jgi:hypothetical protein
MSFDSAIFSPQDHWKALVLYGLNTATYKIAFGKTLLKLATEGITTVSWDVLSRQFLDQYIARLSGDSPMPQLDQPGRITVMERVVAKYRTGNIDYDEAIELVGQKAFGDVVPRFQKLGRRATFGGLFYDYNAGQDLVITDDLLALSHTNRDELEVELDARWGLLEGAFKIGADNFHLNNDLRLIYIENGYERTNITKNIPFLQGYQGNTCFYCGEPIGEHDVEVDHVLPRQVIQHDQIWNLALAHSLCNGQKTDRLIGPHFLQKLIARNENIMGSNHPWKKRIENALGKTKAERKKTTQDHYKNVSQILGWNYWGGDAGYSPETDPFFKRMITVMNNG